MQEVFDAIHGLAICGVMLLIYLLPFLIAKGRRLSNRWSIFLINLFFGWTLIGWVACLSWAVSGTAKVEA
jgi:hypothetical protein